jgi:hypothetical protein
VKTVKPLMVCFGGTGGRAGAIIGKQLAGRLPRCAHG